MLNLLGELAKTQQTQQTQPPTAISIRAVVAKRQRCPGQASTACHVWRLSVDYDEPERAHATRLPNLSGAPLAAIHGATMSHTTDWTCHSCRAVLGQVRDGVL